jgi:hypothetical protein
LYIRQMRTRSLYNAFAVVLVTVFTGRYMASCSKSPSTQLPFEPTPVAYPVSPGIIDEASGLADSHANPGFLWVLEDSQNPTELRLLDHNGQHGKKIVIKNVTNRDWEELVIADGPVAGKKFVYIGETGDNSQVYNEYIIYRFEEPSAALDTVFTVDKLRFKYPDGAHDAEAFFVEPASRDIYIITKRDAKSKVYRLPYPQSTSSLGTAVFETDLPYSGVVGAAFNLSRHELLIKTYDNIYYYPHSGQTIANMLQQPYTTLGYVKEPQGEALCFTNDQRGFFTLSEKAFAASVNLNYYKRK